MSSLGHNTFINPSRPFWLSAHEPVSISSITNLSTINGFQFSIVSPPVAYINALQTSSMNLYQASTTLCAWQSAPTGSNIDISGYDLIARITGVYKMGASLQLNNQSGNDIIRFFFLKNDVRIPFSASWETIANNQETLAYAEIVEPLTNGDRINIGCYTSASDVYLSTIVGNLPEVPTSPAVIATLYKIA